PLARGSYFARRRTKTCACSPSLNSGFVLVAHVAARPAHGLLIACHCDPKRISGGLDVYKPTRIPGRVPKGSGLVEAEAMVRGNLRRAVRTGGFSGPGRASPVPSIAK